MEHERWLSVAEVVARTGLAERTVRKLIAGGRLPVHRPRGLRVVRIPERALEALIER